MMVAVIGAAGLICMESDMYRRCECLQGRGGCYIKCRQNGQEGGRCKTTFCRHPVWMAPASTDLRHELNARLAFLCTSWTGYPLNVWPSGTARWTACWNSLLPAVTPGRSSHTQHWL